MERKHGPVARRVFESLLLEEDANYLDIGCGNGYTVRWAAAVLRRGRAFGIDISPRMIERARALSAQLPNVRISVAAFPRQHGLPYGTFDAIFSMETFYYMPDVPEALSEVLRLLKPGGVFVSAIDYYEENLVSHGWRSYVGTEMHLWTAEDWKRAFERAGFQSVTSERLVLPPAEAVEPWHATVGTLVTRGRRSGS